MKTTQKNSFAREIAAYVAFAFATVGIGTAAGAHGTIDLQTFESSSGAQTGVETFPATIGGLRHKELSSIKALVDKYREVEKFIPGGGSLDGLEFVDTGTVEQSNVPLGVDPRIAAVSREQFETASKVHQFVERISTAVEEGNEAAAKETYTELSRFVQSERETLYGRFDSYQQMNEVLGAYSEGRGANFTAGGGAVIFVIIEIYVS